MVRKKILATLVLALAFSFSAAPLALAAKAGCDDEFGCKGDLDKAVYDNAKSDGLSNADASAKAG